VKLWWPLRFKIQHPKRKKNKAIFHSHSLQAGPPAQVGQLLPLDILLTVVNYKNNHLINHLWSLSIAIFSRVFAVFSSIQRRQMCPCRRISPLRDRRWDEEEQQLRAALTAIVAADVILAFAWNKSLFVPSVLPSVVGVAVAKRSSRNVFMGNLGGRRSCHSHTYSPAGWLLPYKHPLSFDHNSSSPCDPNQGIVSHVEPFFTECTRCLFTFTGISYQFSVLGLHAFALHTGCCLSISTSFLCCIKPLVGVQPSTLCFLSVQSGVLERLSSWLAGKSVQSVYGRHRRGCNQTLRWQPQWTLLWQHGCLKVWLFYVQL